MTRIWSILLYESITGEKPVEEFILSLTIKGQSKVARTFDHLEEFGPKLGAPHMKKLAGSHLWELRILGGDSIRIFYITTTGKTFLLLHGITKKKQKTPRKEIDLAEKRLLEYTSRERIT